MLNTKFLSIVTVFSLLGIYNVTAENLASNASFEEEGELNNADTLIEKGFKVDAKHWAKGWIINAITSPAEISIVEEAGAPDGKKIVRIKTDGNTHLYTNDFIPGRSPLKLAFTARGDSFKGKNPSITLTLYQYKLDGTWYGKNYPAGTYKLEKDWKTYTVDIPTLADDVMFRVAFEIEGLCDIDNLKVEK